MTTSSDRPQQTPGERRIVVGIDGSDESVAALRRASRLAALAGCQLELVTAWSPTVSSELTAMGWNPRREAEDMSAYCAAAVFGPSIPPWVSRAIVMGNSAEVLVEASRGAEMLVVGKKSHSAFTDLIMGSVSERCANTAHCPVLIVPFAAPVVDELVTSAARDVRP